MTSLFGTDGIRGRVGEGMFTQHNLLKLGHTLAHWFHESNRSPHILMVHDTRISCSFIKSLLKGGLLTKNLTIYDAGILPTAAALYLIQQIPEIQYALIISASHNPYYDNGIKIFTKQGKLTSTEEQRITHLFNQDYSFQYDIFGQDYYFPQARSFYSEWIKNLFPPYFLAHKKIILDVAHGSTSSCAQEIFESFGAQVILLHNNPDGFNINQTCGSVHPRHLQEAVIAHKADAGFAFDGDGDRIIAVNKRGLIKDGDDILAILLHHPAYSGQRTIVGTVLSNYGFELFLKNNNKTLYRAPVGDKYIIEHLTQHNFLLGGEPSGHIIMRDILPTGDGILTALRILETLSLINNEEMETFVKYPQISVNLPIKEKRDLTQPPYTFLIKQAEEQLLPGRLVIRYSGTEPLLRVTAESANVDNAQSVLKEVALHLQILLEQA